MCHHRLRTVYIRLMNDYDSDWVEAITKLPSRSFLSNLVGTTLGHEETDVANKKINHPAVVAHTLASRFLLYILSQNNTSGPSQKESLNVLDEFIDKICEPGNSPFLRTMYDALGQFLLTHHSEKNKQFSFNY